MENTGKYMVIKDNSEHQKAIELIAMKLWSDVYVAAMETSKGGMMYYQEADYAVTMFRKKFFGEE